MLWNTLFCLVMLGVYELLKRWLGGPWYHAGAITLVLGAALGAAQEYLRCYWRQRSQSKPTLD